MAEKDYAELFLDAMNILVEKKIESIRFDETVNAVVTDASKASEGVYTVSTGNSKFTAYSTETAYKENDAVMVTIPQGNYDNQKIIISKQVDNSNTPIIYRSPFQQLVNVSNNLIEGEYNLEMWANSYTSGESDLGGYNWNTNISEFKDCDIYRNNACIWETDNRFFQQGFTRLGLSAQFSTWLNEYNTVFGNYGLVVELTFKCLDAPTEDDHGNPIPNTFVKFVTFDSSEFFGDIYNFETYYTQEKLYDLSDYADFPIVKIRLFMYQRKNFFTSNGESIYQDNIDFGIDENGFLDLTAGAGAINPNIFIKDPYICLGISVDEFSTDTATLFTDSSLTYSRGSLTATVDQIEERERSNLKTIGLRWVHKDTTNGLIKAVQPGEIPPEYEIRWYRYQLGASSPDQFAGAHWVRYYGTDGNPETFNNELETFFQPDVNLQSEKIRAIVIKRESDYVYRLIAASNILEFTNNDKVRSDATIIEENALGIIFNDDEKGHYFLYNRAGQISKEEDKELRTLTAVFDPEENNLYKKSTLTEPYESIIWTFPLENTMIIPASSDKLEEAMPLTEGNYSQGGTNVAIDINDQTLTLSGDRISVGFFIKPVLNRNANNNTVRLEVKKGDQLYTAQVQMLFGTAGTSGSDYTLFINWENGKNAINLSENDDPNGGYDQTYEFDHILTGEVLLMDQTGNIIEIPDRSTISLKWKVASETSSTMSWELEDRELYYPVFFTTDTIDIDNKQSPITNSSLKTYAQSAGVSADNCPANESYFYISEKSADGGTYYEYSLIQKAMIPVTVASTDENYARRILYRKARKNKLEYKIYDLKYDDDSNEYDPLQRFFVKHGDQYILDPWSEFQETETYYFPVLKNKTQYQSHTLNYHIDNTTRRITIDYETPPSLNGLFILEVTLNNFGDYPLVAYFPIPLKSGEKHGDVLVDEKRQISFVVDYIEGPTDVRYSTDGETDFNKNPYQITTRELNRGSFITKRHGYNSGATIDGYWKLITPSNWEGHAITGNYSNSLNAYLSSLSETLIDSNNGPDQYNIPLLNPIGTYFEDAPPYGVQFCKRDGTPLWTQPIFVYKDNYPSTTLNKWNGKDIDINEEQGSITANAFAAGKKESDNTFTGVVLGDWSRTDSDTVMTKQTGVYGFNHGKMSYALKDDGTAFFGKDGKGRIYLSGEKAQIYSSNWISKLSAGVHLGMLLDIDDGYIKLQQNQTEENHVLPLTNTTVLQRLFDLINYGYIQDDNNSSKYSKLNLQADGGPLLYSAGAYFLIKTVPIDTNSVYMENYYLKDDNNEYTQITQERFNELKEEEGSSVSVITSFDNSLTCTFEDTQNHNRYFYWLCDSRGQKISPQGNEYVYNSETTYYYNPNFTLTADMLKYITLSAKEKRFPLAIGAVEPVSSRPFRVAWDGKTYITDGEFTGIISASGGDIHGDMSVTGTLYGGRFITDYLDAREGFIGGWTIENSRLYIQDGYAELSADRGGTIKTQYGEIGGWTIDQTELRDNLVSSSAITKLSTTSGITTDTIHVIGKNGGGIRTEAKIGEFLGKKTVYNPSTSTTTGDTYEDTYLTGIQATIGDGIALEAQSNKNIRLSGPNGGTCNGIYLTSTVVAFTATADNQHGIYARFA